MIESEPTTPLRPCNECGVPKPLDSKHFPVRGGNRGGRYLRFKCRDCTRVNAKISKTKLAATRAANAERPALKMRRCADCAGMPHRVVGVRCRCGMRYEAEPKPELQTRRYYERAV